MNGRTVLALVLAPIACAAVFGAWIYWGLRRPPSQPEVSLGVLLLPGMMYGALFEIVALMPLLLLIRRWQLPSTRTLVIGGLVLWALAVIANVWATSQVGLSEFSLRDMGMVYLPLILPGVALVVVFALVVRSGPSA